MTKQEFIEQAVLRLITATSLTCNEVVHRASQVASLIYDDEKEHEDTTAGKDFKNESLAALLKEVDRLDVLSNKNSKVKRRGYAKTFARVCSSWDINTIKDFNNSGKTTLLTLGKVGLGQVSRNNRLGIETKTR